VPVINIDADANSLLVSRRPHCLDAPVPRSRSQMHTSHCISFSAAHVQPTVQCFLPLTPALDHARFSGQAKRGVHPPLGASPKPLRRGSSAAAPVSATR
jgi:hypothetical protein